MTPLGAEPSSNKGLWVAIIILVVWLVGFALRAGEGSRWYRWLQPLTGARVLAAVGGDDPGRHVSDLYVTLL